jgi:hypothetical protein
MVEAVTDRLVINFVAPSFDAKSRLIILVDDNDGTAAFDLTATGRGQSNDGRANTQPTKRR